jgi:hypothetical protein
MFKVRRQITTKFVILLTPHPQPLYDQLSPTITMLSSNPTLKKKNQTMAKELTKIFRSAISKST